MKFILANVLRDARGENVLCSRYSDNITSHIEKDYNLLTNICNNPYYKSVFHKQKDFNKLSTDDVNKLSFRKANPSNEF